MKRRKFLASAATTGTVASAGCLNILSEDDDDPEPTVDGTVVEGPENIGRLDKYSRITNFSFEEIQFEIKSNDRLLNVESDFRIVVEFSDYTDYDDYYLQLESEQVSPPSDGDDVTVTIPLVQDVDDIGDDPRITDEDEVRGEVIWLERVPRAQRVFGHTYIEPVDDDRIYLHETERFRTDHEVILVEDHPLSLENTESENFERYNLSGAFLLYCSAVTRSGIDWAQEFKFPKAQFIGRVQNEWNTYQSAAKADATVESPLHIGIEDVIDSADVDDVQDNTVTRAEIALSLVRGLPQSDEMDFPSEWDTDMGIRTPQEVLLNGGPRQSGDAAVLFTACVSPAENQRSALVQYPRDMAAAVTGDLSGNSYTIDEETFYYIHLSSELDIGEEPPVDHTPELFEI